MKQSNRIVTAFLAVIMCVAMVSCAGGEATKDEAIAEQVVSVLNNTRVHSSYAPTIGAMVVAVFYEYDLKWEAYQNSETQYKVTISGSYCPNPEVPNMALDGYITYVVDINSGSCRVLNDPNNISATFLLFIIS